MKETLFYTEEEGGIRQCNICQRRCKIAEGEQGYCQSRKNIGAMLVSLIYAKAAKIAFGPVETNGVYHFYPKSRWLSVGSLSCNFKCPGCQDWQVPREPQDIDAKTQTIKPQDLINLALKERCDGISFTYNEPTMWLEYTFDVAKLAKKYGLYTSYITNASMTPEALELIAHYLDVFIADLKGFSTAAYKKIADFGNLNGILEIIEAAKNKYHMHVEIITCIIPGYNDDLKELAGLARWILDTLGFDTPWHITQFLPQYRLKHLDSTPVEVLEETAQSAQNIGLKFVYISAFVGHPLENTYCPNCQSVLIRRRKLITQELNIDNGACTKCNTKIFGRFK